MPISVTDTQRLNRKIKIYYNKTCLCDHHFERTRSVEQKRGGRETEFANKNLKKTYRTALLPNGHTHTIIVTMIL